MKWWKTRRCASGERGEEEPPTELFVSAQSLAPVDHVAVQASAQSMIDSSISKTVKVRENIAFADFQEIYRDGDARGCKGLTTYRPNAVTGSVLSVEDKSAKTCDPDETPARIDPPKREEKLEGTTYKLRWPETAHALNVTINNIDDDDGRRPFEIFINSKNMDHYAWRLALTRMISAVFRCGGDVSFVAEELRDVFDPREGARVTGPYVPSLLAAIGDIVERHMAQFAPAQLDLPIKPESKPVTSFTAAPSGPCCPQYGVPGMIREEGCNKCLSCGYSKCG